MSAAVLSGAGIVLATALTCAAILLRPGNLRSAAMLVALALVPALILVDQWDTARIEALRDTPLRLVGGAVVAAILVVATALAFWRWPVAMPLAIAAAIPFRVPLQAGEDQANLLVPLYLAIAAGALYVAARDFRTGRDSRAARDTRTARDTRAARESRWVRYLTYTLVAVVALYALQSLYSLDRTNALQDFCFFLVPFALMFVLLRDVKWTPWLLGGLLAVFTVEAIVFTLFGTWEFFTRTLIWNEEVMRANDFHTYFRVNSLFWDPNIFGRFLAFVAIGVAAVMLWAREYRTVAITAVILAAVWFGTFTTYSLSSFAALLGGLAVLAAMRWSVKWTLLASAIVVAAGAVYALGDGGFETDWGLSNRTSGRSDLIAGGVELFGNRPLTGYGSASFSEAYRDEIANGEVEVSVSHTEPITVAAEQGIPGLIAYFGVIVVAFMAMGAGLRGADAWNSRFALARVVVLGVFVALMVHTLSYAGFLDDPMTWLLLALTCVLGSAAGSRENVPPDASRRAVGDTHR